MKTKGFGNFAKLGASMTAVAALVLAGCGGGGLGTNAGGAGTTTTTITPFKGNFLKGDVTLTDASGNRIALVSGGTINTSGVATVTYANNVAYPLTVSVNGTYLDETLGTSAVIPMGTALRGLIPTLADAQAASGVPVTVVTDIARAMLPATGSITSTSAVAAITGAASSVFGIGTYADAMTPPTLLDANGKTSDARTVRLTAFANVLRKQKPNLELVEALHGVATQLATSAVNVVVSQAEWNTALAAVNATGVSGVLPAGTTPPTINNTVGAGQLTAAIATTPPPCATGETLNIDRAATTGLRCVAPAAPASTGGTTAPTAGSMQTGYFVDAPVKGISYSYTVNGQTTTATTGTGGAFTYPWGNSVTFSIGKITLGSVVPQGTVTPIHLAGANASSTSPVVQNIVQLLLSLDPAAQTTVAGGGNPSSITIAPAVLTAANNLATPLTIGTATLQADLQTALNVIATATTQTLTLVTPTQASAHVAGTINKLFAGNYSGTYTGAVSGSWSIAIDAAGQVTGTATGCSVTGAMQTTLTNGGGFVFAGDCGGYPWGGTLNLNTGAFSGTWDSGVAGNTYTGTKAGGAAAGGTTTPPATGGVAGTWNLAITGNVAAMGVNQAINLPVTNLPAAPDVTAVQQSVTAAYGTFGNISITPTTNTATTKSFTVTFSGVVNGISMSYNLTYTYTKV